MFCYTKRDKNKKKPGIFPFLFTTFFGLTKDSKNNRTNVTASGAKKTTDAVFILILREPFYILYFLESGTQIS